MLLAGALPLVAFPAPNLEFLAWVALVPGLVMIVRAPALREAWVRTWWFGAGYLIAALYWMAPQIGPGVLLLGAVFGGLWVPFGVAAWRLIRPPVTWLRALAALVIVPSGWLFVEWIRSWQALGGPWDVYGASQWQHPAVLALAAVGGIWLISFVLVAANVAIVLGDTDAEAAELAREVRRAQVSPQTALRFIEQLWNTELPGFDVDGPLPGFDPVVSDTLVSKGRASVRQFAKNPVALAAEWRARAEQGKLSAREVVIEVTGRQSFIGAPRTVAAEINERVQADAADGYILVPHITPDGLAPFVDTVVPLLQERGVFRADYTGATLRDHLGLAPLGAAVRAAS